MPAWERAYDVMTSPERMGSTQRARCSSVSKQRTRSPPMPVWATTAGVYEPSLWVRGS